MKISETFLIRMFFKCTYVSSKVGNRSRGRPEGSLFNSYYTEGATPFPGLLHFTLDTYFILLTVKQGGIKYHFKSFWYDVTSDWTPVSRTIGEWYHFYFSPFDLAVKAYEILKYILLFYAEKHIRGQGRNYQVLGKY